MSRFNHSFFAIASALILFCCGCQSEPLKNADREELECRQCAEKLVRAFLDGDEKKFFAQLPSGVVSHYGPKELAENRAALFREFGKVDSIRFLTSLETPQPLRTLVWVVRFRRPAVSGEKEIFQEVLCRVVIGKADDRYQIYSFAF